MPELETGTSFKTGGSWKWDSSGSAPHGSEPAAYGRADLNESIVPAGRFGPAIVRAGEVAVAAVCLAAAAPVCAVLYCIIRADSPGSAIFRQQRLGKDGKPFKFYKFRTLHVDARQRYPHLYQYQYTPDQIDQLHFKVQDDPRVTRVGRWLRKSTLDELPNFLCVLTGKMALVGPRPEIPEMLPYYQGEDLLKFSVRPGVTGLAQVSGRGRLSFKDTVKYDLQYVRERSILLDLKIVIKTVILSLKRDGAF